MEASNAIRRAQMSESADPLAPKAPDLQPSLKGMPTVQRRVGFELSLTFDQMRGFAEFVWTSPPSNRVAATGWVRCVGFEALSWALEVDGANEREISSHRRDSIRAMMKRWLDRFSGNLDTVRFYWVRPRSGGSGDERLMEEPFEFGRSPYSWIEDNLVAMAEALRGQFNPHGRAPPALYENVLLDSEAYARKLRRKELKREEAETKRKEAMARLAGERRIRDQRELPARKLSEARGGMDATKPKLPRKRGPQPAPSVLIEAPMLEFQDTAFPAADLRNFSLRERAALWWVSNQSDDLLCLPSCRIERLDFQIRTALRVLGSLRGRALLSDEVGLGKTIEAGLILKELLTRGMAKRFLVLTTPSLVDQWQEELSEKFGLATGTTNQPEARGDPSGFWGSGSGIVASLHTLKQPAHLEVARQIRWDVLIVDEAHHLRNRTSLAWQAVNTLPRQFLLLLTATPVQNSVEELYNLVTLLKPGGLPSPREFRMRFINPKRPRHPREPEELRRLLSQVMIRNTRSTAGIELPPRRAETVLFEPDAAERAFWERWEAEFRLCLAALTASQASLWGRLLLQAAGSSPAAWRTALAKFPDKERARIWQEGAPLEASWRRKCELIRPLVRLDGGLVVFTQFLETQAALGEFLRAAQVDVFVVNGATPAADRQGISEEFRRKGGALLLTQSGSEGRNLQISHRLANFDLPWNPMVIEQRIGRLHRLGQRHPVEIYNFVQAGTLQEHLLRILQEKLNLFELVVGETGLVLGERYGSDEFADEILRRWRESEGRLAASMAGLGEELAVARGNYGEIKRLDETLFARDFEL
jgi:SNF2 family DNA or RNA helicase